MEKINTPRTIYSNFSVVGFNPLNVSLFDQSKDKKRYIDTVDIFMCKAKMIGGDKIENEDTEYLRMSKKLDVWLRIKYTNTYADPITSFRFLELNTTSDKSALLIKKKYITDHFLYPINMANEDDEPLQVAR